MICPGIAVECDNPGCRHGGCQGRPPQQRSRPLVAVSAPALFAKLPQEPAASAAALGFLGAPPPVASREPVAA